MTKQPLQGTARAEDSCSPRLDCPHCSYETKDPAAYEYHLTSHSQVNPNPRPQTGRSMTADELTAFIVDQCQTSLIHAPWPTNDQELERLAQHLAGNLLMAHEVVPKRVGAHIRKTHQQRRNP